MLQLSLEEADLKKIFRVASAKTITSFYDTGAVNEQLVAPFATAIPHTLKIHVFEIKHQSFRVKWT
jgi:hypothetical protein